MQKIGFKLAAMIFFMAHITTAFGRGESDVKAELKLANKQLERLEAEHQSAQGKQHNLKLRINDYKAKIAEEEKIIKNADEAIKAWTPVANLEDSVYGKAILQQALKQKRMSTRTRNNQMKNLSLAQKELEEAKKDEALAFVLIVQLKAGMEDLKQELKSYTSQGLQEVTSQMPALAPTLGIIEGAECQF